MPGSVANAVATTVMPFSLSRLFRASLSWPVIDNEYKNGESQRSSLIPLSAITGTSRKAWEADKRLISSALESLRSFHEARKGTTEAFYFYDPYGTSPLFSYDETGVDTVGRHKVRFDGEWSQIIDMARIDVPVRIIEVA